MLSFWEKQHLTQADVLIVGAGITGLSTACSLLERHPGKRVVVFDSGILPTGASTRNAGFACIGSITEKMADYRLMGEAPFLQLIEARWQGLHLLRKRLGDDRIDYQAHGGYELIDRKTGVAADQLAWMNQLLHPIFGKPVFSFANNRIAQFGFQGLEALVLNTVEGQLNTGRMMDALWGYASGLGARIITGARVEEYMDSGHAVQVSLSNGMVFHGGQLVICTNAFTNTLLPGEEIIPGRGQVLITDEIPGLPFQGIFHFEEGYYYFRNLGNRILFGGGRNLDFEGEATTEMALNPVIQQQLDEHLQTRIIPGRAYTVTDRWAGIMAFGKNKLPLVKRISNRVVVGARLNGMGIALGSKIGEQLANLLS